MRHKRHATKKTGSQMLSQPDLTERAVEVLGRVLLVRGAAHDPFSRPASRFAGAREAAPISALWCRVAISERAYPHISQRDIMHAAICDSR